MGKRILMILAIFMAVFSWLIGIKTFLIPCTTTLSACDHANLFAGKAQGNSPLDQHNTGTIIATADYYTSSQGLPIVASLPLSGVLTNDERGNGFVPADLVGTVSTGTLRRLGLGHSSVITDNDWFYGWSAVGVVNDWPVAVYSSINNNALYYVRANDANALSWSEPTLIPTPTDASNFDESPVSLREINGHPAIIYWYYPSNNKETIIYSRAEDITGTVWSEPQMIGTGDTRPQLQEVNGHPALLYEPPNLSANNHFVVYRRALDPAGLTWGAPITLGLTTQQQSMSGNNLQFVDGYPTVTYAGEDGQTIYFQRAADINGASWLTPTAVGTGSYPIMNVVNNQPIIIYNQNNDFYMIHTADGGLTWSPPQLIIPNVAHNFSQNIRWNHSTVINDQLHFLLVDNHFRLHQWQTVNENYDHWVGGATDQQGWLLSTSSYRDQLLLGLIFDHFYAWLEDWDGTFIYTPPDHYSGVETFAYQLQDESGLTSTTTVTLTISPNARPQAVDDEYLIPFNSELRVDSAEIGPLANDLDDGTNELSGRPSQYVTTGTLTYPGMASVVADADSLQANLALVDGHPATAYITNQGINYRRALDSLGTDWDDPLLLMENSNLNYPQILLISDYPAVAFQSGSNIYYMRALDSLGQTWADPVLVDQTNSQFGWSITEVDGRPAFALPQSGGIYYLLADDAAGNSWSQPIFVGYAVGSADFTTIKMINDKPAIGYTNNENLDNTVWYVIANDSLGLTWDEPILISSSTYWLHSISLLTVDNKPTLSFAGFDGNIQQANMFYVRANDAHGHEWLLPTEWPVWGGWLNTVIKDNKPVIAYMR
ncbi:MAG TPA: cadherin-like domain-containing protein [Anaerolineae bacterium]|nr:cadherin-like domain-containing protein [Anaerolineae bacterium]